MKVSLHARSRRDIIQIGCYLAQERPAVADRFYDSIQQLTKLIAKQPKLGVRRLYPDQNVELRMLPIPDFENYLLFYVLSPDRIRVVRVLHSAQDWTRYF